MEILSSCSRWINRRGLSFLQELIFWRCSIALAFEDMFSRIGHDKWFYSYRARTGVSIDLFVFGWKLLQPEPIPRTCPFITLGFWSRGIPLNTFVWKCLSRVLYLRQSRGIVDFKIPCVPPNLHGLSLHNPDLWRFGLGDKCPQETHITREGTIIAWRCVLYFPNALQCATAENGHWQKTVGSQLHQAVYVTFMAEGIHVPVSERGQFWANMTAQMDGPSPCCSGCFGTKHISSWSVLSSHVIIARDLIKENFMRLCSARSFFIFSIFVSLTASDNWNWFLFSGGVFSSCLLSFHLEAFVSCLLSSMLIARPLVAFMGICVKNSGTWSVFVKVVCSK